MIGVCEVDMAKETSKAMIYLETFCCNLRNLNMV
jgi:hypothetical protein